jgi:hypothetical protein
MSNPMIPQGTINRLIASINFADNPQLNVIASFLGKEGVSFAFEGNQTLPIEALTGIVTSPEPYQMVTVTAHLLRSQALAATYLDQIRDTTVIGGFTVYSDSTVFPSLDVQNGFIKTTAAMLMNGTQADFTIELGGYILLNNALWN